MWMVSGDMRRPIELELPVAMAKDKKKDKKEKKATKSVETDALAAVRSAVERTLQVSAEGAQSTRARTKEIVEEIAAAAGKVRGTLEDMKVLDEVKRLRREVEALASRVASLEVRPSGTPTVKTAPAAAPAPAPGKPAAIKRKPAARKTAAKRKPAAAKKPPAPTPAL